MTVLRSTAVRRVAAPALVALAALVLLLDLRWTPLRRFDVDVADSLNRLVAPHPDAVHVWKLVSEIGQPATFQILSVLAAVVLWVRGHVPVAVFCAATVLGAGLLSTVTKLLVGRHRPTVADPIAHAAGSSFPSGHAMASFVAVGVLFVLVAPRVTGRTRVALVVGGVLVAALIAFSRLALGVHYVSDIAGGWLIGLLWLVSATVLLGRVSDRRPRAPAPPSSDRPRRTPV